MIGEIDEDAFAITCRTGRGVCCLVVDLLRKIPFVNFTGPDLLAGLAVEAEKRLGLFFLVGSGEKDLLSHHDGGTMALAGNGGNPADVFGFAEFQWEILIGMGVAGVISPPSGRPVPRIGRE